jgi:excisionase family DNA binding protein
MKEETLELDVVTRQTAAQARRQLLARMAEPQATAATLRIADAQAPLELPQAAATALLEVLHELEKGNTVAIVPVKAELSTQEAAALLDVSRPHFIRLLEQGALPHRLVGTHRRVRLEDVLTYKRQKLELRKAALRELAAQAQELGMGYE